MENLLLLMLTRSKRNRSSTFCPDPLLFPWLLPDVISAALFVRTPTFLRLENLKKIPGEEISPEEVIATAIQAKCLSIAYTYTEPTIFFEYAQDIALLADGKGLKNVFVTNGYMTKDVLEALHPHLHAANVDLKAFREDFYKTQCGAKLSPVLETLKIMKRLGDLG